jgi:hypothetical protein
MSEELGSAVAVGSRVLCLWKRGPYEFPAEVIGREGDEVIVKYDDGDVERAPVALVRRLGPEAPAREWKTGDAVWFRRLLGNYWYPGNVVSAGGGSLVIATASGKREEVSPEQVAPFDLGPGGRVFARPEGARLHYPATVVAVSGDRVTVAYEDGGRREETGLGRVRVLRDRTGSGGASAEDKLLVEAARTRQELARHHPPELTAVLLPPSPAAAAQSAAAPPAAAPARPAAATQAQLRPPLPAPAARPVAAAPAPARPAAPETRRSPLPYVFWVVFGVLAAGTLWKFAGSRTLDVWKTVERTASSPSEDPDSDRATMSFPGGATKGKDGPGTLLGPFSESTQSARGEIQLPGGKALPGGMGSGNVGIGPDFRDFLEKQREQRLADAEAESTAVAILAYSSARSGRFPFPGGLGEKCAVPDGQPGSAYARALWSELRHDDTAYLAALLAVPERDPWHGLAQAELQGAKDGNATALVRWLADLDGRLANPSGEDAGRLPLLYSQRVAGLDAVVSLERRQPKVVSQLIRAAEGKDERASGAAAALLGAVGPPAREAVPVLSHLLEGGPPPVQWQAAHALGQIGPAARPAVPALEATARGSDADVAAEAARALLRVRGD